MPEPEILVAAGATATVSVAATLASTSILKSYQYYEAVNKKNYDSGSEEFGKKPRSLGLASDWNNVRADD